MVFIGLGHKGVKMGQKRALESIVGEKRNTDRKNAMYKEVEL